MSNSNSEESSQRGNNISGNDINEPDNNIDNKNVSASEIGKNMPSDSMREDRDKKSINHLVNNNKEESNDDDLSNQGISDEPGSGLPVDAPRIDVTFHVYLPSFDRDNYIPIILGSIPEIGKWNPRGGVMLSFVENNYWISPIIKIPIDSTDIEYKYVLHSLDDPNSTIYEGITDENRRLEPFSDVFDIWARNYEYSVERVTTKNDISFVIGIMKSLNAAINSSSKTTLREDTADAFKKAIWKYELLLKQLPSLARTSMSIVNVIKIVDNTDSPIDHLFVFILLAYSLSNYNITLPNEFPSGLLLLSLPHYNQDLLSPKLVKSLKLEKVIEALVEHNSTSGLYDWMIMFGLLEVFGTSWFESVEPPHRSAEASFDSFKRYFYDHVVPNVVPMQSGMRISVLKCLIKAAHSQQILLTLYDNNVFESAFNKSSIEKFFFERIYMALLSKDAVSLQQAYGQLPKQLTSELRHIYQKCVFNILEEKQRTWNSANVAALFSLDTSTSDTTVDLIHSLFPLPECADEFQKMFELLANSSSTQLSNLLPEVVNQVIFLAAKDHSSRMKKQLLAMNKICNSWYRNQPGRQDILYYLNRVTQIVPDIKLKNFWPTENFLDAAKNRINASTGDQILRVAPQVGALAFRSVREMYFDLAKSKLLNILNNTMIGWEDRDHDPIPESLSWLCEKGKALNIPNKLCEELIVYAIEYKLKHPVSVVKKIYSAMTLINDLHFWVLVLEATGEVTSVNKSLATTRMDIKNLATDINNMKITVRDAKVIIEHPKNYLLRFLNNAQANDVDTSATVTQEKLEQIEQILQGYQSRFKLLKTHIKTFGSYPKVTNYQSFLNDLDWLEKEIVDKTIADANSTKLWVKYSNIIHIAESVQELHKSRIFMNLVDNAMSKCTNNLEVEKATVQIVGAALDMFREHSKRYEDWRRVDCFSVKILWHSVIDASVIRTELEHMRKSGSKLPLNDSEDYEYLVNALQSLTIMDKRVEQLKNILLFKDDIFFHVKGFNIEAQINDYLHNLDNADITLMDTYDLHVFFNKYLADVVNDKSLELWKALREASKLLMFIVEIKNEDLKNWINAVDDITDDSSAQEAPLVTSLEEIKRELLPVLINNYPDIMNLLKDLKLIADKNTYISSKIRFCNHSLASIKQIHLNISNRGEATRERIKKAVTGKYTFQRVRDSNICSISMQYVDKDMTIVSYSLADLIDLRGRGLLLVDSANKFGIEFSSNDPPEEDIMGYIREFVNQVDIVGDIMDTAAKLLSLGHFAYQEFSHSVNSSDEMKNLHSEFVEDLLEWKEALETSRLECYYITYFKGCHLHFFRDLSLQRLDNNPKEETMRNCITLFRYYSKDNLPKEYPETGEMNLLKMSVLKFISKFLEGALSSVPLTHEPTPTNFGRHVVSDIVVAQQPFVALCRNQNFVPNVIMSLYANCGYVPQPSQVLLCQPTTTEEELDLILKRCFWDNGTHDRQLFCIASVEKLTFEAKSFLVKRITELQACHGSIPYLLSLVCVCGEDKHFDMLDDFTDFIHHTDGLGEAAMDNLIRHVTNNCVEVLSSDISGQGKTYFIQKATATARCKRRILLICDTVDRAEIVRQLHTPTLEAKKEYLHIIISNVTNPSELNLFLFEMLVLRVIFGGSEVAFLPRDLRIYIELESLTIVNRPNNIANIGTIRRRDSKGLAMLELLPFISHFNRHHLTFDINTLDVSTNNPASPMQIVARYLSALRERTIDSQDVDPKAIVGTNKCRRLLQDYYVAHSTVSSPSMRLLTTFVRILANQLQYLSQSPYLCVSGLNWTGINISNIRTILLNALINVSRDFALRSMPTEESAAEPADYVEYMNTMKKWTDSNHLLVFFQSQNEGSICMLYRNPDKVAIEVKQLLISQSIPHVVNHRNWNQYQFIGVNEQNFIMPNFSEMPMSELLIYMEMIARKGSKPRTYPPYALSVDNLLKMALILLRIRSVIPVVICGEAGCGKTSQIAFLANMVQVPFLVFDIHAGTTKDSIDDFIATAMNKANQGEVWVFLDEINTCNHLGMLASLICDRQYKGREIHKNIRLLAACNPYRRRREFANNAGLQQSNNIVTRKQKNQYMEQSELVYQVHPLPHNLLDLIWDYGVLEECDENAYIKIMANHLKLINSYDASCQLPTDITTLFADLLSRSQKFIREIEDSYSVSLRDVRRTINFANFFDRELNSQVRQNSTCTNKMTPHRPYPPLDKLRNIRPLILALALCYQGRLADQSSRQQYRTAMCEIFIRHNVTMDANTFVTIVRDDQLDIVSRMNLPAFTACNEALLENVHSMTACILTRTPLFVIGAPGASKSLAIMIVKDNLRGRDSVDPYFQTHPQVYIIPHQGSSSSTSEGILKVFAKAERYETQHDSDKFPSRAVVLLDEVGLAETSPHNPLKVLHALLEPRQSKDGNPPVAVIGISNWRLDASKMSRAVRILKPVQNVRDLEITTRGIVTSLNLHKSALITLAAKYTAYQNHQPVANFHGLRDYYALVKCLGSYETLTPIVMKSALARNFGGGKIPVEHIYQHFFPWGDDQAKLPNALECIKANLKDPNARHLMVIGETDFTIDVLENCLSIVGNDTVDQNKRPRVIYGSQFPDDQGPEYAYRILNTILLCVEEGRPVILKDLQIIYGSLYDLWNQNYTTVGSGEHTKKFCRVALGEYANSMCPVHPNFRCIVVMDHETVRKADPPLLNRFEKQLISWSSLLSSDNQNIVDELALWVQKISMLQPQAASGQLYNEAEMFVGFCGIDTLRCLVLLHSKWGKVTDREEILQQCKQDLIQIACSESIVRVSKSRLAAEKPEEILFWQRFYFEDDKHNDLRSFVERYLLSSNHTAAHEISGNIIIKTFSSINTNIKHCLDELDNSITYQIEKLEFFKAERQLQSRIRHFWLESDDNLLVIQCDPTTTNQGTMKLARFLIDHHQKEYLNTCTSNNHTIKRACIMVHIRRGAQSGNRQPFKFDFLCDWYQIVIEDLMPQVSLQSLLEDSINGIVKNIYPLKEIIIREFQWCILCISYTARGSLEHIQDLVTKIPTHNYLITFFLNWTENWLKTNDSRDWQFRVACNRQLLGLSNSFSNALEKHVRHTIRSPLAKLIYTLEKSCALRSILQLSPSKQDSVTQLWEDVCIDRGIVHPDEEEDPKPNGYSLTGRLFDLKFPFSRYLWWAIESYRPLYEEDCSRWNTGGNDQQNEFTNRIMSSLPFIHHQAFFDFAELYVDDFLEMALPAGTSSEHCSILRGFVLHELDEDNVNPVRLHLLWWAQEEKFMSQLQIMQFSLIAFGLELKYDITQENLIDIVSHHVLYKLYFLKTDTSNTQNEDTNKEWLRSASLILALCSKVPEFTMNSLWRLLSLVCDMFSTLFLPARLSLRPLLKILGNPEFSEIRSTQLRVYITKILAYLAGHAVPEGPEKEACYRKILLQILDIIRGGFEIIPLESLDELQILDSVFARKPLPLSAPLVYQIFKAENNVIPGIFCRILSDGIISEGMLVINRCLNEAGLQSPITIICCDIIQERFFGLETEERLTLLIPVAVEIIIREYKRKNILQYICAIALFKALLRKLSSQCRLTPQAMNVKDVESLIVFLNTGEPQLKHCAIVFFLQCLRNMLGLSSVELRMHLEPFGTVFPWLTEIDWKLNYNQNEFDPYCFNDQSLHAAEAFSQISNNSSRAESLLPLRDFHSILGFLGAAANALYSGVQWNNTQMDLVGWLRNANVPSQVRTVLDRLILCRNSPLFPSNPDDAKALLRHSIFARVILVHASMKPECSPLARYLHNPDDVQRTFVLTCQLDERTSVLSALRTTGGSGAYTSVYQCTCGTTYVVGNCGMPVEQSRCPTCKNAIGSGRANRSVAVYPTANKTMGYTQETIESFRDLNMTVHVLNTTAFRILHLFTHIIFAFQPSTIAQSVKGKDPVLYCLEHIENDWNVLRQILLCDDETLHLLLHAVLTHVEQYHKSTVAPFSTVKMVEDWEAKFMKTCVTPISSNMHQALAAYRREIGKMELNRHTLERELKETMDISTKDSKQKSLAQLWRYTGYISSAEDAVREMSAYVGRDPQRQQMFPVLQLYFTHKNSLDLLGHLMPLVRFSNELSSMFLHRIKRDEARKLTFTMLFDQLKKQDFHKYDRLSRLFDEFQKAWNAIRGSITHYKCQELAQEMPIMNEECAIMYALYDPTNESVYLCAVFEFLAGLQNGFLQDVSQVEREGCSSLLFLQTVDVATIVDNEGNTQLERGHVWPLVKVLDLQEIQVISAANAILDSHLLTFYQWGLDYGGGQDVEFDLLELEWRIARLLVLGKVHIQPDMEAFTYTGEMFKRNMRIVDEISALIPQVPLEATVAAQIRGNEYIIERASDLLTDLQMVLYYIQRTKGGDGKMSLAEYCRKWLDIQKSAGKSYSSLLVISEATFSPMSLGNIKLKHIVALYEAIEDIVSDRMFDLAPADYLQSKYTLQLDAHIKHELNNSCYTRGLMETVAIALKRFVFRHLRDAGCTIPSDLPINGGGYEELISSNDAIIDALPDGLLIGHALEAYMLLTGRQPLHSNTYLKSDDRQHENDIDGMVEIDMIGTSRIKNEAEDTLKVETGWMSEFDRDIDFGMHEAFTSQSHATGLHIHSDDVFHNDLEEDFSIESYDESNDSRSWFNEMFSTKNVPEIPAETTYIDFNTFTATFPSKESSPTNSVLMKPLPSLPSSSSVRERRSFYKSLDFEGAVNEGRHSGSFSGFTGVSLSVKPSSSTATSQDPFSAPLITNPTYDDMNKLFSGPIWTTKENILTERKANPSVVSTPLDTNNKLSPGSNQNPFRKNLDNFEETVVEKKTNPSVVSTPLDTNNRLSFESNQNPFRKNFSNLKETARSSIVVENKTNPSVVSAPLNMSPTDNRIPSGPIQTPKKAEDPRVVPTSKAGKERGNIIKKLFKGKK